MENNPKKSKALIITIIVILVILLVGYLIIKNRDSFGVKTSSTIAKIFAPLIPSENNKNLTTIDALAGEDIKKGDEVSVFGTGTNNNPIIVKTSTNNGEIYGYADQDIKSGYVGKIVIRKNTESNNFWDSFSGFIKDIVNPKERDNTCQNGATNYPECNTVEGLQQCSDKIDNDGDGFEDEKDPNCHINGDLNLDYVPNHYDENVITTNNSEGDDRDLDTPPTVIISAIPSSIAKNEFSVITWMSTNATSCTLSGGEVEKGSKTSGTDSSVNTVALTKSTSYTVVCTGENGLTGSGSVFVGVLGSILPDLVANKVTPQTTFINTSTTLSSVVTNIGNGNINNSFSGYFSINGISDTSISETKPVTIPALKARDKNTITTEYTFTSKGDYSIAFCVDKKDTTDKGEVSEASENNNCSDPINFKVTDEKDALPDLVANKVTPQTTFINTSTTLSSVVTNIGNGNINNSFSGYFSINGISDTSISETKPVTIPALQAKSGNVANTTYTFTSQGNYSVRFCVDKNNANDNGVVNESNEDNNCSIESTLTVSNSLPTGGSAECNDEIDNDGDKLIDKLDSDCYLGGVYYDTRLESGNGDKFITECNDEVDNDGDKLIDKLDSDCYLGGVYYDTRLESGNGDEATSEANKCLLIAQNPLIFTNEEKSKLAELLRKFYIIAPTLKTEDDISLIYKEMDNYSYMIENIEDLTQKCYAQTISKDGKLATVYDDDGKPIYDENGNIVKYTGPTTRGGNPWYDTTTRPSYIPEGEEKDEKGNIKKTNYCTGTFNSKMKGQKYYKNCSELPKNKKDCDYYNYGTINNPKLMRTGCSWVGGTDLTEYEKILNIW